MKITSMHYPCHLKSVISFIGCLLVPIQAVIVPLNLTASRRYVLTLSSGQAIDQ